MSQYDPFGSLPSGPPPPAYEPPPAPPPAPMPAAPTPASPRHSGTRSLLLTGVIAALVGASVGAGTVALVDDGRTRTTSSGITVTTETGAPAANLHGTVSAAAAKIQPSVVTLLVTGQEQGTGSGVIIRGDGYILTNNHVASVAAGGGSIMVETSDGRRVAGRIVGADPSDDLAVVKVNLSGLTAATFAKSANLVVGQTVVAVGAPLGLSNTVTSGIVSNVARPVRAGQNNQAVFNAVQTDAAINPGNSGGPLVDLNGNVVGIDTAIATASSGGNSLPGQAGQSGNIGIGFAIPSDEASRIAAQLIATGKASHAIIGVSVSSAPDASVNGAQLRSVDTGGPAAKAGLRPGDVVTAVGRQRVEDGDGLIATIRSYAPGETVPITYQRGGTGKTVNVRLATSSS
jgi:putative serine protease PepD